MIQVETRIELKLLNGARASLLLEDIVVSDLGNTLAKNVIPFTQIDREMIMRDNDATVSWKVPDDDLGVLSKVRKRKAQEAELSEHTMICVCVAAT